jgi:hypothetical protein
MSTRAIFSLLARRNELGRAMKWQIYLSKVSIGFVIAALLWLVSLGNISTVLIGSGAVFITSKVCYYLATGDWPNSWDSLADWLCDGALHFAWYGLWAAIAGDFRTGALLFGAWLCSYPWSCE